MALTTKIGRPVADYMAEAKQALDEEDRQKLEARAAAIKAHSEGPARAADAAEQAAKDSGRQMVRDVWPSHPAAGGVHPARGWPVVIPFPYVATKNDVCVNVDGHLHPICNAAYWVDRGHGGPEPGDRHDPRLAVLVKGQWVITEAKVKALFDREWLSTIKGLEINQKPIKRQLGDGSAGHQPCWPSVLAYLMAAFDEVGERRHSDRVVGR